VRRLRARGGAAQAGFVLPAVLVILVVVSAAAATAALRLQTGTTLAGARADGLRLQGLADGIARLVAYGLVVERIYRAVPLGLPEDGRAVACPLPGGRIARIAVRDEGALIDLNTTARPQLEAAFRALGIPDRDAPALAAEIVDFRDADDTPEPGGGGEAPQYQARGLAAGPRNGPFRHADEIDQLPSMTPAFAALLRPAVTVHNPNGRFDAAGLRRRAAAPGAALPPAGSPSPRQVLRIGVSVAGPAGARAGRTALVATTASAAGIGILEWVRAVPPSEATAGHPACPRIAAALGAD
jgi:general secretion pathway protein K